MKLLKCLTVETEHSNWSLPFVPVIENEEALHYQHKHLFIVVWLRRVLRVQTMLLQERLGISSPRVHVAHHHVHVESIEHFNKKQPQWFSSPA